MMRIALIVLAIYTTALSCISCQDKASTGVHAIAITVIKTDAARQQTADIDLCTPFCSCTCCASAAMHREIAVFPVKAALSASDEITFTYICPTYSGDLTSIWQPPRV